MNETDPALIDAQIAAGLQNEGIHGFVNNFMGHLPGGFYRSIIERNSWLDNPAIEDDSHVRPGTSERIRTVTWRQFFNDVDQAIPDSGASREEIVRLKAVYDDAARTASAAVSAAAHKNYIQATIPVYRQLRIIGYSHEDLIV
jgi:hypothetical protein